MLGRREELNELNELYESGKFQCVIMYGRRRVGKTTLIAEFIKDKKNIFLSAQENSSDVMLEEFSQKAYKMAGMEGYGKFASWQAAFSFVGDVAMEQSVVMVIDEFPYLAKADTSIKSVLQHAIDHKLKNTKLFIILCGSQISFIEKEVLGYNSPLYGRRTAQMRIEPFNFADSRLFFPSWSVERQIEAYAILGGIPLYLQQFDEDKSIEENIKKFILKKYSYLYEEPLNLLKQELREPAKYNAIIEAIANGASSMNDIATKTGINTAHCSSYLNTLASILLIKKELPLGDKVTSRKGIYQLQDNFFRFWYRYVFKNRSEIELGLWDLVYDEKIRNHLTEFYGHVFEDVCQQHFIQQLKTGKLPYSFSSIGRWWGNNKVLKQQEEIDIYAIGSKGIYIGECKYRNELVERDILENLVRRGEQIFPEANKTYVCYSKFGYDDNAIQYAAENNIILYDLTAIK